MSVVKVVEIIATSEESWEDAVEQGVKKASQTIENITGVEVTATTASVENGEVTEYRATMKIAFVVRNL
ncbi:MAG: dodecin family protein [Clostridia bacterium]